MKMKWVSEITVGPGVLCVCVCGGRPSDVVRVRQIKCKYKLTDLGTVHWFFASSFYSRPPEADTI